MVWKIAADHHGTALLRIEDTDSSRVRPAHEASIYQDLAWLGLQWPTPVRRQSDHKSDYDAALKRLAGDGLIYPCACTRRQIIQAGAVSGADGMVYPGTCRARRMDSVVPSDGIRLNVKKALQQITTGLHFTETGGNQPRECQVLPQTIIETIGDPILRRKDTGDPSYHLACVHDDALQQVSHVVRGKDLEDLTPIHVLLQNLLGYPTPIYHHHDLVLDDAGKRLAKIDHSKALGKYRDEGLAPDDIKKMIGLKG